MSCQAVRNTLALTFLAISLVATPSSAANDQVCQDYDRKHTVKGLGGDHSFHKASEKTTCEQLQELLKHRRPGETHWQELTKILKGRGLGHLAGKLWSAIEGCGENVKETQIENADTLYWMTFRKSGGATSVGADAKAGVCFDVGRKTYNAFEITVTETDEGKWDKSQVNCDLKLTGGGACAVKDPITLEATSGATVKVSGQSEPLTPTSSGENQYTYPAPQAGSYSFDATWPGKTSKRTTKTTTHTFVVPKVCLNLAYNGSKEDTTTEERNVCKNQDPKAETHKVTVTHEVPDCKASLSVTADPPVVKRGEPIQVTISGDNDKRKVVFKKDGEQVNASQDGSEIAELTESGAISFKQAGAYSLEGTASRCEGICMDKATAEPVVVTVKPGWTARFFGVRVDPDEGPFRESSIRPNGVSERSHLHLDGGAGAGAELEYHFNERIGLAASAIFANLGSELFFDLDDEWESDEDDVSFLSFLIGPNFHLTPDKKADVYLGLFVGLVDLGSTSYQVLGETQRRSFDADTAFGAQLGVDIPFGQKGWGVNLAARYLDMTVETGEDGPEVAADPLILQAGFSYKF